MQRLHGKSAGVLAYFLYSDGTVVQTIGRDTTYHRVIAYVAVHSAAASRQRYAYITLGWLPTFVLDMFRSKNRRRKAQSMAPGSPGMRCYVALPVIL